MSNRPSAPAPRSSPSDWRMSEIVKAYRHRIAMQMGNEFLADYHDDLDLLCDAVASYGERGGGLEEAARECDKYAVEMRRQADKAWLVDRPLHISQAESAEHCARRIRALSSSPPSTAQPPEEHPEMTPEPQDVKPLPCPFCKGIGKLTPVSGGWCVECDDCHARGPKVILAEGALGEWNRRAPSPSTGGASPQPPDAEREALAKVIQTYCQWDAPRGSGIAQAILDARYRKADPVSPAEGRITREQIEDLVCYEWYECGGGMDADCQCARCGSSCEYLDCPNCEDGFAGHDCGDDCCPCLDPEPNVVCDWCGGSGGAWHCVSSPEWCEAHPIAGRENIPSTALKAEAWNDV